MSFVWKPVSGFSWLPVDDPGLRRLIGFCIGLHDVGRAFEFLVIGKRFQHLQHILASAVISSPLQEIFLGRREMHSFEVGRNVRGRMSAEPSSHDQSPLTDVETAKLSLGRFD
jgi:hypothetical protein